MSKFKDNCTICVSCHESCSSCPNTDCQRNQIQINNMKRVNKLVRMDSSRHTMIKRTGMVSKQVGQSAFPEHLDQAGGPGDLIHAVQKNCGNNQTPPNEWRKVTYRVPTARSRTAYRNNSGVDKKHGSYARFLARRVGGVLRKEKMPGVIQRTAIIKQPINRTRTNCGVRANDSSIISTKVQTVDKTNKYPNCFNENCCRNRILGTGNHGDLYFKCNLRNNCARNPLSTNFSGLLGNNTQCHGKRCKCCRKK